MFQRIVARLDSAEPGRWVLKGGMALEVRLLDAARLTKDIDLGLREAAIDPDQLHALSRTHKDGENSRVRHLVDIALLAEHDLLDLDQVAVQARIVWSERESGTSQSSPPPLPASWPERYERIADEHNLTTGFADAIALYDGLWAALIRTL